MPLKGDLGGHLRGTLCDTIWQELMWVHHSTAESFFEEAVFTGALVSRMMDAMDWNRQLPGTGIVSDLSLKLVGLIGSMTCSRGV